MIDHVSRSSGEFIRWPGLKWFELLNEEGHEREEQIGGNIAIFWKDDSG